MFVIPLHVYLNCKL